MGTIWLRRGVLTVGLIILAGCTTPEERAAKQAEQDRAACASYGFVPGTSDMAKCVMLRAEQRDAMARAYWMQRLPR